MKYLIWLQFDKTAASPYWDVNDKLPSGVPRMRRMNIEDFNHRRNLPTSPVFKPLYRSPLYYFEPE